jgi:hypothetical protein
MPTPSTGRGRRSSFHSGDTFVAHDPTDLVVRTIHSCPSNKKSDLPSQPVPHPWLGLSSGFLATGVSSPIYFVPVVHENGILVVLRMHHVWEFTGRSRIPVTVAYFQGISWHTCPLIKHSFRKTTNISSPTISEISWYGFRAVHAKHPRYGSAGYRCHNEIIADVL